MTLNEVLVIMNNRLVTLNEARKAAVAAGDLDRVNQVDGDLMTTLSSIEKLKETISLTGG